MFKRIKKIDYDLKIHLKPKKSIFEMLIWYLILASDFIAKSIFNFVDLFKFYKLL